MITQQLFEEYNGQEVYVYLLSDKIDVIVCSLGASVLSVKVHDRFGKKTDVALGMTSPSDMVDKGDYMGAVVGRCGNRIANGQFTLNGETYRLAQNNGTAHLHGGKVGFNQKNFEGVIDGNSVVFEYVSPDGEEGYPGKLKICVRYTVKGSALAIDYYGESDKDTVFNPTNHTYFNLNGEDDGSILDNVMQINADRYLEIDESLIPTVKAKLPALRSILRRLSLSDRISTEITFNCGLRAATTITFVLTTITPLRFIPPRPVYVWTCIPIAAECSFIRAIFLSDRKVSRFTTSAAVFVWRRSFIPTQSTATIAISRY